MGVLEWIQDACIKTSTIGYVAREPCPPWAHQQCWQPCVCPSCDGAWANLTFLSTALLHPQLQCPMPKLSRFKPLLRVAMLKKSETFTSIYTPLIALHGSDIYSPIAQTEVRQVQGFKKHVLWHKLFPPASDSSPLMCRNLCLYKCFSSIHPFQPLSHAYLHRSFSFLSGKT